MGLQFNGLHRDARVTGNQLECQTYQPRPLQVACDRVTGPVVRASLSNPLNCGASLEGQKYSQFLIAEGLFDGFGWNLGQNYDNL